MELVKKTSAEVSTSAQSNGIVQEGNSSSLGKTIQRNYILNDTAALKKKIKHENRKEAFTTGNEAKDGSNTVILCKTSFFEHVKDNYIKSLSKMENIIEIVNAVWSKSSY